MTSFERKHHWLMTVYGFGALVALAVAWIPSFMCRSGSAVLVVGLLHMMWQRRNAVRKGLEEQAKVHASLLHYAPFLVGTNLIWMGLPLPVDAMTKAWADCVFLAGSIGLLSVIYVYNYRALNALSDAAVLGTNPHSEEG
jgi:peptidoglycan/LPS O-acetylase OafA/YrhL